MENRINHLRHLLDREFRYESNQEEAGNPSTIPPEEEISEGKIFPAVRRCFFRGLYHKRGDDNVG